MKETLKQSLAWENVMGSVRLWTSLFSPWVAGAEVGSHEHNIALARSLLDERESRVMAKAASRRKKAAGPRFRQLEADRDHAVSAYDRRYKSLREEERHAAWNLPLKETEIGRMRLEAIKCSSAWYWGRLAYEREEENCSAMHEEHQGASDRLKALKKGESVPR